MATNEGKLEGYELRFKAKNTKNEGTGLRMRVDR